MNFMHLIQFHRTVLLVMCVWLMVGMRWREEWRCAEVECGELLGIESTSLNGATAMPESHADSWDILHSVSTIAIVECNLSLLRSSSLTKALDDLFLLAGSQYRDSKNLIACTYYMNQS